MLSSGHDVAATLTITHTIPEWGGALHRAGPIDFLSCLMDAGMRRGDRQSMVVCGVLKTLMVAGGLYSSVVQAPLNCPCSSKHPLFMLT